MRTDALRFAATLTALSFAAPALACFETDTTPRPYIWFTGTGTANVAIEGLVVKAGGIGLSDYCAIGLGHSNTVITGVTGLAVVDDADPTAGPVPITGLSFSSNGTTSTDFTTAEPASTWAGYHSSVSAPVAQGTPVAFVFSVTVSGVATYQDIIGELQNEGLLGFGDASAGGNIVGTPEADPIIGASELPYCYDDAVTAGEQCDGASDMGCGIGQTCVECSVCLTGNPANACKSEILKSLAYAERSQLKCYANAAKAGNAVDPMCLSDVNSAALYWMKYVPSCPQTLPPDPTVQGWLDSTGSDLAPILPLGSTSGAWKCASQKFKAASFRAAGAAKCYSKAYRYNTVVDPNCLTKVDTKYQAKFAKAELPGLCDAGNLGNVTPVANRADQFVSDMVTNIPPP